MSARHRGLRVAGSVLALTLGAACAGDRTEGGGTSGVRSYLEAMREGRCADAFAMVTLFVNPDPKAVDLLDRASFEEACRRHPVTGYDIVSSTSAIAVVADVRYAEGTGRTTFERTTEGLRVRADDLELQSFAGPAPGVQVDGVDVGSSVSGRLLVRVVPGFHTVSAVASPWTEAFSGTAAPRVCQGVCLGSPTFPLKPALKPAAATAARRAFEAWRSNCAQHEWVCDPPACFPFDPGARIAVSIDGEAQLGSDGTKDAWAVELAGQRTCPKTGTEAVQVVVRLPLQGRGSVFDVRAA